MPVAKLPDGWRLPTRARSWLDFLSGRRDRSSAASLEQATCKDGRPLLNEIQPATCRSGSWGVREGRAGEATVAATAAEGRLLTACWSYEMPSRLVIIEYRLGSLSLFSSSIIPGRLLWLGRGAESSPASECNLLTCSVLACCWSTRL